MLTDHHALIDGYDRIAFIDEDIETDRTTLSRSFDIGKQYDLGSGPVDVSVVILT